MMTLSHFGCFAGPLFTISLLLQVTGCANEKAAPPAQAPVFPTAEAKSSPPPPTEVTPSASSLSVSDEVAAACNLISMTSTTHQSSTSTTVRCGCRTATSFLKSRSALRADRSPVAVSTSLVARMRGARPTTTWLSGNGERTASARTLRTWAWTTPNWSRTPVETSMPREQYVTVEEV